MNLTIDDFKDMINLRGRQLYYEENLKGLESSIKITKQHIERVKAKLKITQLELKDKTITLQENIVLCGQDFKFFRGAPEDIEFTIKEVDNRHFTLVGPRHGAKGDYGSGSIHASFTDLQLYFDKQLENNKIKKNEGVN